MHNYVMQIDVKSLSPKLARLKDVAGRLERACKRQKDLLDLQDRALRLRTSAAVGGMLQAEVDREIAAIHTEQSTLVEQGMELERELVGLEVQIRDIVESLARAGDDLAVWQPLMGALKVKMPEPRNPGDCIMMPDVRLLFIRDVLYRLNELLGSMDIEAAHELIRKPELVRPPFSGWYFRADIGSGRESIHPIFGDIVIGHKPDAVNGIEIVTDHDELNRYFQAVSIRYAAKRDKASILSILQELEKRVSCGIFFRDSRCISTLHGLIEVRGGILQGSLFLHALGINPIALRREQTTVKIDAPLNPIANPTQLLDDDVVSVLEEGPFSIKVYQSSLEVHSLLVACDSGSSNPNHFTHELYGVRSELSRFARFGTISELNGRDATIQAFEERLLSYRQLHEDATLAIVITVHGLPGTLSFIDGNLRKERLLELLAQIPCKKLLIVNACHAGGFWDDMDRIPPKTMIASSSKRDQVTYGGTFLQMVANAFATGQDLKKLDGVIVRGGFNGRTHEAGVEGQTIMMPGMR